MIAHAVVVSGAAGGIGQAVVERFARGGAHVLAVDIDPRVDELEQRSASTRSLVKDVADPANANDIFDLALTAFGRIDAFVHCVGVSAHTHVLDVTHGQWDQLVRVNVSSAFYLAQAACRAMVPKRTGAIVFISSQLAEVARRDGAPYVTAKGALRSLAMAMALDMAPHNIRVNCVGPGVTETPMLGSRRDDPDVQAMWKRRIPLGRLATPADVASAAFFLAGDEASYITGTSLYVDGGYLAT